MRVFSRHSDEVTKTWMSDVVPFVEKRGGEKSWILDVEIVAKGEKEGKVGTFQQLSTRKRTHDDLEEDSKDRGGGNVEVRIFAFDCLVYDGLGCLEESLRERREKMKMVLGVVGEEGFFEAMPGKDIELGEAPKDRGEGTKSEGAEGDEEAKDA